MVGAAPASVLVLSDDTVSRYHVELDLLASGLRIRDLRSTNGTFLEDQDDPVEHGFLWPDSRFRLGETWLRVEANDELVAPSGRPGPSVRLGGLVGRSVQMQDIFRQAERLATGDGSLLLTGPNGSGRAAVARQMHRLSPRKDKPLFTVDAELDASMLFEADPLLHRAAGGTVLLRNVERLSKPLQIKLRDTIVRGTIRPEDKRRIDVRLIATCQDATLIEPSLRRHLGAATLEIPALSDRPDEIVPLAEHFLHGAGWSRIRIGPLTARRLAAVDWPDEVAGLSRLVQRLPRPPDTVDDALPSLPEIRAAFLTDLLNSHEGNVSAASEDLSVPTAQLFRTLHAYAVDID